MKNSYFQVVLGCIFGFALGSGATAWAQQAPEPASRYDTKTAITAKKFMVSAANPLAVQAGYAVLKRGGSAVDAAIATQLALNVVEPQSSGIGGGGFMLVHQHGKRDPIAYDGRETAPLAADENRFMGSDGKPLTFFDAVVGGKSVGTPGTVKLLATVHAQHGKLPWAALFEPAIALAENGFPVPLRLHNAIKSDRFLKDDPQARAFFYDAEGVPHPVGYLLRNPALAQTLRTLAQGGEQAFYRGEIAQDIVNAVHKHRNPGDLSLEDFARYEAKVRAPTCAPYHQWRVCGMPPPSSGGIAINQILGLLEPYSLAQFAPDSALATHLFSEAGRLAFGDRNEYLGDPAFVHIPSGLIDKAYLSSRRELISMSSSIKRASPGTPPGAPVEKVALRADYTPEFPATSHISVVDAKGNAVAFTSTIEDSMGARLMVRGFLLNNELTDFSFLPREGSRTVANRVEPGKRPRSSLAPTIVYDARGRVHLVTGSAGGSAIINYVARSIIGVLDWGLDPQAALNLPHVGSRNGPTELERGTAAEAQNSRLQALGHETRILELTSGTHAIARGKGGWVGGADPRRDGTAMGD